MCKFLISFSKWVNFGSQKVRLVLNRAIVNHFASNLNGVHDFKISPPAKEERLIGANLCPFWGNWPFLGKCFPQISFLPKCFLPKFFFTQIFFTQIFFLLFLAHFFFFLFWQNIFFNFFYFLPHLTMYVACCNTYYTSNG